MTSMIPVERVQKTILLVRGQKVILDSDLAALYGVATKVLNQAVRRNAGRFPSDFMFQLTAKEFTALRSRFVTSNSPDTGSGGRRYRPYAFTEHGALMAANVLNSGRAVDVSIAIVRAFVRLRELLTTNAELARKLEELEQRYDSQFRVVFDAISELMDPPGRRNRPIGYQTELATAPKKPKRTTSRPVRPALSRTETQTLGHGSALSARCDEQDEHVFPKAIQLGLARRLCHHPVFAQQFGPTHVVFRR